MKYQIELIRNINLNLVLSRTEAKKDPHDRAKWHTCRGILSVTSPKFMNWSTGTGGGGAIDLFIHLYQCDFKTALAELCQNFSNIPQPNCMLSQNIQKLSLPQRNDHHLPRIISYLHIDRRIPIDLIHKLIASRSLYADQKANAVFLLLGKKKEIMGQKSEEPHPYDGSAWQKAPEKIWAAFMSKIPTPKKSYSVNRQLMPFPSLP